MEMTSETLPPAGMVVELGLVYVLAYDLCWAVLTTPLEQVDPRV